MRLPFFNRPSTKSNSRAADELTEDPERQKARHRLIGAVFLVTVAVAGLPLLFDSQPKQYTNDIAIQIIQPGSKDQKISESKSGAAEQDPKIAVTEIKKEEAKDTKQAKKEEIKSDKPTSLTKTLDKGEEVVAILESRQDKKSETSLAPNTSGSSKYIIQIGAFSSEERVKNWQIKLKEQKVDSFVELKTSKEGVKLHLLRSGPYPDKASAEAAEKKIRYVGLNPKVSEQKPE
jgi:DedD protein